MTAAEDLAAAIKAERSAASLSAYYDGSLDTGRDYETAKARTDALIAGLDTGTEREWAVAYRTDLSPAGVRLYNEFPDEASCERFVANPPLWFDTHRGHIIGIVSRRPASGWTLVTEATS